MSTRGGDTSGWGEVTDANAMVNGVNRLHIVIPRARDGYKDDVQYTKSMTKLTKTTTDLGALLLGSYSFVAYHQAPSGLDQAKAYWSLINPGGSHLWHLPPAVDAERHTYTDENGVRQTWPMPTNPQEYLNTFVLPQISYLSDAYGQRPIFYSNPDLISNYLKPVLGNAINRPILECKLFIAAYTNDLVQPSYWDRVSQFWPSWFLWQYKGDVKDWPGVTDLDLFRYPGTRAQLKAQLADPSLPNPAYVQAVDPGGAVDVPPVVIPPTPTPTTDLAGLMAKVDQVQATLDKHFK